jgi:4-diphosphocytidyl-2-C-methyl-D-erythritol kinase
MEPVDSWTHWPAPAKLNLFLHIVGRRDDGYHLLQTVFQLLDWGDTVRLRVREDGAVKRASDLPGVTEESDLCIRAAHLLCEQTKTALGAEISVEKRIPIGGGLGGGSSDAATTLVGLNAHWQTGLSIDALAELGLVLGADVPLFVRGFSAWAEGIGEKLTPVPLPQRDYVIVDPQIAVATAPLFQAAELTRNSPPTTIEGFLAGTETTNVFAPLVRARFAQVAQALDWLGQFGDARLTGSGGCVFVAMDSPAAADILIGQCPPMFRAYHARGVNRSPLQDALADFSKAV